MLVNDEVRRLASAMERDLADRPEPVYEFAHAPPPAKVIDCVLSLNRRYESFVVPRVRAFLAAHPDITTCGQLLDRLTPDPAAFLANACNVRDSVRAATLLGVTRFVIDAQKHLPHPTEAERLRAWAAAAAPGDYLAGGVRGFGLVGFQYLRMHFDADTTKPDVHIVGYVSDAVGRRVTELHAILLLEQAAKVSGQRVRRLDALIWERRARR